MSLQVLEVGWAALCDGSYANQLLAQHPRNHHAAQSNDKSSWVSRVIGNPRAGSRWCTAEHCAVPLPLQSPSFLPSAPTSPLYYHSASGLFSQHLVSAACTAIRKNTREVEDTLFPTSLTSAWAFVRAWAWKLDESEILEFSQSVEP